MAETKKAKKNPHICIHKYCLQYFLVEIKHLMKKPYIICVLKRENTNRWFKKRLKNLCESLIYYITCIKIV